MSKIKTIRVIPTSNEMKEQGFIVFNGMKIFFNTPFQADETTINLLKQTKNYRSINTTNLNVYQIMEQMSNNGFDISFQEAEIVMNRLKSGEADARIPAFTFDPEIHVEVLE